MLNKTFLAACILFIADYILDASLDCVLFLSAIPLIVGAKYVTGNALIKEVLAIAVWNVLCLAYSQLLLELTLVFI
ncbi:MAG: hypothetical protein V2I33_23850 [Kangiellaceae bacterium]|jgi:hypothetical protein|nr:hypothetical protein [Kangiellaceae bacterium]